MDSSENSVRRLVSKIYEDFCESEFTEEKGERFKEAVESLLSEAIAEAHVRGCTDALEQCNSASDVMLKEARSAAYRDAAEIVDAEEKRWGKGTNRKFHLQKLSEKLRLKIEGL